LIGLYPKVTYKDFKLSDGIELLALRNRPSSYSNHGNYMQGLYQRSTLSKVNIPTILGYELNFKKLQISPYLGWVYNSQFNYAERYRVVNKFEGSNESVQIEKGVRNSFFCTKEVVTGHNGYWVSIQ
jgi:hypothetical protein